MSTVCRVCLVGNIKMYSIESDHILETYERLTNSKVSLLFGPMSVCYTCRSMLQKCYKLAEVAQMSEDILKDLCHQGLEATFENICTLHASKKQNLSTTHVQINSSTANVDITPVTVILEPNTEAQDEDKRLVVDLANLIFVRKDFTVHKDTSHIENNTLGHCKVAEQIECTMEHIQEENPDIDIKTEIDATIHIQDDKTNNELTTTLVKEEPRISESVETYQTDEVNIPDKVNYKVNAFNEIQKKTEIDAPIHIQDDTTNELTTILVKEEPRISESVETYQSNEVIVPDKVNYKVNALNEIQLKHDCVECCRNFMTQRAFKSHMENHDKKYRFACHLCEKKFFFLAECARHIRLNHNEKSFSCDICGKKFKQKSNFNVHLRKHTRPK